MACIVSLAGNDDPVLLERFVPLLRRSRRDANRIRNRFSLAGGEKKKKKTCTESIGNLSNVDDGYRFLLLSYRFLFHSLFPFFSKSFHSFIYLHFFSFRRYFIFRESDYFYIIKDRVFSFRCRFEEGRKTYN